jgi:Flp pilus assembly protein TadG
MKLVRKGKGKEKDKERGQSLTEMALVLPVILIILAGVLDLGRLYFVTVALTDAAAEGATFAAIDLSATPDEILGRAQAASGGLVPLDAGMITVECPVVAPGAPVTVTVGYTFTVATPLINLIVPNGELRLEGVATEPILGGEM